MMAQLFDESELRRQFEEGRNGIYTPESVSRRPSPDSNDYFEVLLRLRIELVRKYAHQRRVLDLCSGSGEHLLEIAGEVASGVGLDFSMPFLKRGARQLRKICLERISFVGGSARTLPFKSGSFDVVYSFSSLWSIPEVDHAITEVRRVLIPGGRCIIELGNLLSLNSIVCDAYPELARMFFITIGRMKKIFCAAGLRVEVHRAFQLLPLWGERPKWLQPLLWPGWVRVFEKKFGGRMLDEWVSSLPIVRSFAFRHLFVCVKDV